MSSEDLLAVVRKEAGNAEFLAGQGISGAGRPGNMKPRYGCRP